MIDSDNPIVKKGVADLTAFLTLPFQEHFLQLSPRFAPVPMRSEQDKPREGGTRDFARRLCSLMLIHRDLFEEVLEELMLVRLGTIIVEELNEGETL
jgi:hypothetical protein